eukprot:5126555-Pleurochrysis_carterae.AAC.1
MAQVIAARQPLPPPCVSPCWVYCRRCVSWLPEALSPPPPPPPFPLLRGDSDRESYSLRTLQPLGSVLHSYEGTA